VLHAPLIKLQLPKEANELKAKAVAAEKEQAMKEKAEKLAAQAELYVGSLLCFFLLFCHFMR